MLNTLLANILQLMLHSANVSVTLTWLSIQCSGLDQMSHWLPHVFFLFLDIFNFWSYTDRERDDLAFY